MRIVGKPKGDEMKFERELESVNFENWDKKFDYFFESAREQNKLGHYADVINIKLFIIALMRNELKTQL